MIKYWQSMQDYKYFLNESKVHFDSSERVRLHTELWKPWQKLRLFDTDKAMEFLLPFYSNTGRPAKNQPQILRSFILFFLLFSEGLARLSLTLWVDRLKHDRLLAALIGCTTDSLPPLGSYFDFMDRLWTALPCIPMPAHAGTTGLAHRKACGISPTPMLPGAGTATWKNITSATLCSNYPAITVNSGQISPCFCVLPAQSVMIRSISLSLSMNWKNICRLFPPRICAWILQWTITPPTGSLKTGEYGPSST